MKTLSRIIIGVALTSPLAITSAVRADDKTPPSSSDNTRSSDSSNRKDSTDVTMDQLPKAVKSTVQRESKNKNIESMTKSAGSNGAAEYQVKYLDGNKETILDVATNGKVLGRRVQATEAQPNTPNQPSQPNATDQPNTPKSDTGTDTHPNR